MRARRLTVRKGPPIEGTIVKSDDTISFLGDVDPATGTVMNRKNNLYGETIGNKVFAFPKGKGSTVGSYIMYRLRKNGVAPMAILNTASETIVAVGAVISEIPLLDKVDLEGLRTGQRVRIEGDTIRTLD